MGIFESLFGRRETIDDKEKLGHNTNEQSSEEERIAAFENAVNKGIGRRRAQVEEAMNKKHRRGAIAGLALLGITGLTAPAEAQSVRDYLRARYKAQVTQSITGETGKTLRDAIKEYGRYKTQRLKSEEAIARERMKQDSNIHGQGQRTKQTEINTKGRVAIKEADAAQKSGNYMPPRGGAIEVEKTDKGSRTTVRPDSRRGYYPAQGEYERDEADRGARDAEADFYETGRKSTFLSGRSTTYQDAYNQRYDDLASRR